MNKKQDTKAFSKLVLTQLMSSICQVHAEKKSEQDPSIWLTHTDPSRYPFFDFISVIKEDRTLLQKLGHRHFLHADDHKTFFMSQEQHWVDLFELFNSKHWNKASPSLSTTISYVYSLELKGFKDDIRDRFDNILGRMNTHDIDTCRLWLDPLLKSPTVETIHTSVQHAHTALCQVSEELMLASLLEEDPESRKEKAHERLLLFLELCRHLSSLYTCCTILKFIALHLFKKADDYASIDLSQRERCHQLWQQYTLELNAKSGFIFDCAAQLDKHLPYHDFKDSLSRIREASKREYVSFIQALHLLPNPHVFDTLFQDILVAIEWGPLCEYIGVDFATRLQSVRKEIDTKELPHTALSEDDFMHFSKQIFHTYTYARWVFALLSFYREPDAFTALAPLLSSCLEQLRQQQGTPESSVFLQALLLMSNNDSRFHILHELVVLTHRDRGQSTRRALGLATAIQSPAQLDAIVLDSPKTKHTWWNSVHLSNAWAKESKKRLLAMPDSWWTMLFSEIEVQEISQSPLFIGLLDFYESHAREKELIHHFIRSLETKKEHSDDTKPDALLILSALTTQLKRRRVNCPLLHAYAMHGDTFEKTILKTMSYAKHFDAGDDTLHIDQWLDVCLGKVLRILEDTSYQHPPEFIIYPLTQQRLLIPFIALLIKAIHADLKSSRQMMMFVSMLLIQDDRLLAIFYTQFKQARSQNPDLDDSVTRFLNHRSVVGSHAEKTVSQTLLGQQSLSSSHTRFQWNPLFFMTDTLRRFLTYQFSDYSAHNKEAIGRYQVTFQGHTNWLSTLVIRQLPTPLRQHTQTLYRHFQDNNNDSDQALQTFYKHIDEDLQENTLSWMHTLCFQFAAMLHLSTASHVDQLKTIRLESLFPLLKGFVTFPNHQLRELSIFLAPLFENTTHIYEPLELLRELIPEQGRFDDTHAETTLPSVMIVLPHISRLMFLTAEPEAKLSKLEDQIIVRLCHFLSSYICSKSGFSPQEIETVVAPFLAFILNCLKTGKCLDLSATLSRLEPVLSPIKTQQVGSLFTRISTLNTRYTHFFDRLASQEIPSPLFLDILTTLCEDSPAFLASLKIKKPWLFFTSVNAFMSIESHLHNTDTHPALRHAISSFLYATFPKALHPHIKNKYPFLPAFSAMIEGTEGTHSAPYEFFTQFSFSEQVAFTHFMTFDFSAFKQMVYKKHTPPGSRMSLEAVKKDVLSALFKQLVLDAETQPHVDEYLFELYEMVYHLHHQYQDDADALVLISERLFKHTMTHQSVSLDLTHMQQLLLGMRHEFVVLGVINDSWFEALNTRHSDCEKLMIAGIILHTLSQATLHASFTTMQSHYLSASQDLCQAAFYHLIFFKPVRCSTTITRSFLCLFSEISASQTELITFVEGRFKCARDVTHLFTIFYSLELQHLPLLHSVINLSTIFESLSDSEALYCIRYLGLRYKDAKTLSLGMSLKNKIRYILTALATHHHVLCLAIMQHLPSVSLHDIAHFQPWLVSPETFKDEYAFLQAHSESVAQTGTEFAHPLNPLKLWESSNKLSAWAQQVEHNQDPKSFERLYDSFTHLFQVFPERISFFIPNFLFKHTALFWSLILSQDSTLRDAFIDYTLRLNKLKAPLDSASIDIIFSEPALLDSLTQILTKDGVLDSKLPFYHLHPQIQYFVLKVCPSALSHLTKVDSLATVLNYIVFKGELSLLTEHFEACIGPLSDLIYDTLFPETLPYESISQDDMLDILSQLPEQILKQCLVTLINEKKLPVHYIVQTLFFHHYFSEHQSQRSAFLSQLMYLLHCHYEAPFIAAIQGLDFSKSPAIIQSMIYSYLLTHTQTLQGSVLLATIASFGFAPESLSVKHHSSIATLFLNTDSYPILNAFAAKSPTGFRSLLLLSSVPPVLRHIVTLKLLRPNMTLTQDINTYLNRLIPAEAIHFLTHYLSVDLSNKKQEEIHTCLRDFYDPSPQGGLSFQFSASDLHNLNIQLLDIVNTPSPKLSESDPFLKAVLSSFQNKNAGFPLVQRMIQNLETSQHSHIQPFQLEHHMSDIVASKHSRSLFLQYLEHNAGDPESPLFDRLIESWATASSLWDSLIIAIETPREHVLVQQILRSLSQRLLEEKIVKASPEKLARSFERLCFLMSMYPVKRHEFLDWFKPILTVHTTLHAHSHLDLIIQSPVLSQEDAIPLLSGLLVSRKGSLAALLLSKVLDTPLFIPLWSTLLTDTKMPVLLTKFCVKGSGIDRIIRHYFTTQMTLGSPLLIDVCDRPHVELVPYFESCFSDALSPLLDDLPDFPNTGEIHFSEASTFTTAVGCLFLQAIQTKRSGFVKILALFLQKYHQEHASLPTWAYHFVLLSGKISQEDISTLLPPDFDVEPIYTSLLTCQFLDPLGLISSTWSDRAAFPPQSFEAVWPDSRERQAFFIQLKALFISRIQAREHFLSTLSYYCPAIFFEKHTKPIIADTPPVGLMYYVSNQNVPSAGIQRFIDDVVHTFILTKPGRTLLVKGLKSLPLKKILLLLWHENRQSSVRFHLVHYLLQDTTETEQKSSYKFWRENIVASVIKTTLAKINDGALSQQKRLVMQEIILTFFIVTPSVLYAVIAPHIAHINTFLSISIDRLYEARTRFLYFISLYKTSSPKEQREAVIKLLAQGLNVLEVLSMCKSFRAEYPRLYTDVAHAFRSEAPYIKGKEHVPYFLLTTLNPGQQIGRISPLMWESFFQGSDIFLTLQDHHLIDSFGHLKLSRFTDMPDSLKASKALSTIMKKRHSHDKNSWTDEAHEAREVKRFWKRISGVLTQHTRIQKISPDPLLLCDRLLGFSMDAGPLHAQFYRQLDTLYQAFNTFDIETLLSPRLQAHIFHLFTNGDYSLRSSTEVQCSADVFIDHLSLPFSSDDFKKHKVGKKEAKLFLHKLKRQGIVNNTGFIDPKKVNQINIMTEITDNERHFLGEFLPMILHAKRRILLECIHIQHDFFVLTQQTDEHFQSAFKRLFGTLPKHKWSLIKVLINHTSPVFPFSYTLKECLKKELGEQWNGNLSQKSLSACASLLSTHHTHQKETLKALFSDYHSRTYISGPNRQHVSKLISELDTIIKSTT